MKPFRGFTGVLVFAIATSCAPPGASQRNPSAAEDSASTGDGMKQEPIANWQLSEWYNSEPLELSDLRGRVVVARFWTDGCRYCERSLPALEQLAKELRDKPVTFVGIYHSKPLGSERPWKDAVAFAKKIGVTFPIAYDRKWKTVRDWWLDDHRRSATSATLVIDGTGHVVHSHPGPQYFPSDDPDDAPHQRDYVALRKAIVDSLDAIASDQD